MLCWFMQGIASCPRMCFRDNDNNRAIQASAEDLHSGEMPLEILNISRVLSHFHPIKILIRKMNAVALDAKYG